MHRPTLVALAFTTVTIAVHLTLGRDASILTGAIVIAMTGAMYAGFAVAGGRPKTIVLECIVAFAFAGAGVAGVLLTPWWIVAATAAHAGWDLAHHRSTYLPGSTEQRASTIPANTLAHTPRWYIPYCVVYDLTAAAALATLWFARGFLNR